ncbi:hypothetical protein POM88_054662 [Heracleum sosnowskyi]|uniref:VWFA domain-containing protein n=1 Tax=Heracleum sosnowskyi TaxID=360622 RepID=A0AAD8LVZ4_9APIA|nr:hypothetical protein POM88_054662 [Heracleum sosnowskyi]
MDDSRVGWGSSDQDFEIYDDDYSFSDCGYTYDDDEGDSIGSLEPEKEDGADSQDEENQEDDDSEDEEDDHGDSYEDDDESSTGSDAVSSSDDEQVEKREKWIGHYSSSQRILLVGEGDYSFSLCLAKAFRSARNIVASSLDSRRDLGKKYSDAVENVRQLEEMGGLVLSGLDATQMRDHYFLTTQRFDCIVYNFPHVGFRFPEGNGCQIKMNKELVKGFLRNAKTLLKKDTGEIHVSHKNGDPYDKWDLVKKAQKIGLVTEALARAGLESSNLIVGIDFTKSNEWTGARSYQRRSLHHLGDSLNPYEQAISTIGRTLSAFDEDNLIPCYGFGDATTHDQDVFSFFPDDKPCTGFEEALTRYREIVPRIRLAGPTSFAPVIETAIGIVNETGRQYHVLLIIADGQVTRSVDTNPGKLSSQEQSTIAAIVEASKYPLSIILVGVGDGPWDMMMQFDDNIPTRAFDNFQFVDFIEIMSKNVPIFQKETEFALAALMEIPSQYKATLDFQLLSNQRNTTRRNAAYTEQPYNSL